MDIFDFLLASTATIPQFFPTIFGHFRGPYGFWPLLKITRFRVQNSLLRAINLYIYFMVYSRIWISICASNNDLVQLVTQFRQGVDQRHTSPFKPIWLIPINASRMTSPPAHQAQSCCTLRCTGSLKNKHLWWTQGTDKAAYSGEQSWAHQAASFHRPIQH